MAMTTTTAEMTAAVDAAAAAPTSNEIECKSESSKQGLLQQDKTTPKDERPYLTPSPQSGGVPSPTLPYLLQAQQPPPQQQASPRKILVIVDLNGTLLYRPSRHRPFNFIERPHARAFLNYCLDTFFLAIWSSARPQNVHKMVSQLLTPAQSSRCVVIWARDKLGLCPEDYAARVQVYKRLSAIWNDETVRKACPDVGGCWDQSNTVLVDDSREKGRSEPFNILPLPEFSGLAGEVPNVLPQVHDYLNRLCYQGDVSKFIRQNPFELDPTYTLSKDS